MGNHCISPNVSFAEARERLKASRVWTVQEDPEEKGMIARIREGSNDGWVALYFNDDEGEKVKTESSFKIWVGAALELTIGSETLLDLGDYLEVAGLASPWWRLCIREQAYRETLDEVRGHLANPMTPERLAAKEDFLRLLQEKGC